MAGLVPGISAFVIARLDRAMTKAEMPGHDVLIVVLGLAYEANATCST